VRRGRGEACTGFWWENLRERDRWGDPDVNERIILIRISGRGIRGYGLD
jgi:hypothetical protein